MSHNAGAQICTLYIHTHIIILCLHAWIIWKPLWCTKWQPSSLDMPFYGQWRSCCALTMHAIQLIFTSTRFQASLTYGTVCMCACVCTWVWETYYSNWQNNKLIQLQDYSFQLIKPAIESIDNRQEREPRTEMSTCSTDHWIYTKSLHTFRTDLCLRWAGWWETWRRESLKCSSAVEGCSKTGWQSRRGWMGKEWIHLKQKEESVTSHNTQR